MALRRQLVWQTAILAAAGWFPARAHGQPAVLTWHNDNARTGQNLRETILTPANVNVATFGKRFVIPVDGKVDAQPLYVPSLALPGQGRHNVLYVATEHDSVYAFDADTGAPLWQVSLLASGETTSDDRGCFQVVPEIGITATPVIDPQAGAHGTVYAVAMSKDASGNYHQRLHALDLSTGAEESDGPVEIRATAPGSGVEGSGSLLNFDPKIHKERPGLLIVNGTVYTSWGSHCDAGNYTAWVIGYDQATLRQTSVLNLTPNGDGGGIWASGAGPAADDSGNLYVPTGNGTFDTTLDANGFPVQADYGNTFVKLSAAGGKLTVTDYFTVANTIAESYADTDLGSGGLMLLPPLTDPQGNSRLLAVGGGKDATIYVVDRSSLGKFNPQTPAYQQLAVTGVYSSPAWFNGTLYCGTYGAPLRAFAFTNGKFVMTSQSSNIFYYPGATPSISANGNSNGIVWGVNDDAPAVLHAYDASDLSKELYNSSQAPNGRDNFGAGNKFIVPTIANGRVYVGTANGVGVFGLLGSSSPAVSAANAASFQSGAVAPGEIISIGGASLGPAAGAGFSVNPSTGMVDAQLAGTRVLFGSSAAPILYASATQVNAIVPYEIAGQSQVTMQVQYQGIAAASVPVSVASSAPGIFTSGLSGSGQAAALNQDGSLNSPSNPAVKGSYVTLYFTGGGQTSPPGVTGSVTGPVLKYLTQDVSVTVGGSAAAVAFAGAAPTYVDGLSQLNIRLADDTPSGSAQPILLTIGGNTGSSRATLAVR